MRAVKRRPNSQKSRQPGEHAHPRGNSTNSASVPALSRRREWLFRLLAMLVVPLVVFGALEGALRLIDYGYPTSLFKRMRVVPSGEKQAPAGRKHLGGLPGRDSVLHAGHFLIDPGALAPAKAIASAQPSLPAWLLAMPLRFKEEQP